MDKVIHLLVWVLTRAAKQSNSRYVIFLKQQKLPSVCLLTACLLSGCIYSGLNQSSNNLSKVQASKIQEQSVGIDPHKLEQAIAAFAGRVDQGYEDGWIAGRDPRIFKTGYGKVNPQTKAQFAMDYHQFLQDSAQNLEKDIKTYVSYARRAQFAEQWWSNDKHSHDFSKQTKKLKVAWVHEALLDAGELWWRSVEAFPGVKTTSAQAIAHDVEQDMVSRWMEDQRTEGTFSSQPQFGSLNSHRNK